MFLIVGLSIHSYLLTHWFHYFPLQPLLARMFLIEMLLEAGLVQVERGARAAGENQRLGGGGHVSCKDTIKNPLNHWVLDLT